MYHYNYATVNVMVAFLLIMIAMVLNVIHFGRLCTYKGLLLYSYKVVKQMPRVGGNQ